MNFCHISLCGLKMFNDTYVEKTKDKKMLKTEEEHINYQQLNILIKLIYITKTMHIYIYIYISYFKT